MSSVRSLLCVTVLVICQSRLDCARWWCSPAIASTLTLTSEQASAIERVYEGSLPARRQTTERAASLTARVAELIQRGVFGGELLQTTQELAATRVEEIVIRRRTFEDTTQVLTPLQRTLLARLHAQRHLAD